jgi:hypothetical protein
MSSLNVNDGGTFKEVKEVLVKDGGVWKQVNEVHVKNAGTWELIFGVTYVSLSGLQKDFNLATYLGISYPTIVVVTVSSGTHFVSTQGTTDFAGTGTSIAYPAFDVGSLTAGSSVRLSLPSDAIIAGKGGNGGYGTNGEGYAGQPGGDGGVGLKTRFPLELTNNGIIGGGGGGGGGAGGRVVYYPAGSGGGGAGGWHFTTETETGLPGNGIGTSGQGFAAYVTEGYGGIGAGGRGGLNTSPRASDGTITLGGAGSDALNAPGNRIGGTGGNLGQDGAAVVYPGGTAGNAIDGHSYITYVTSGTISGGQVN